MCGKHFRNPVHFTSRNWESQGIWARRNSRVPPVLVSLPGQERSLHLMYAAWLPRNIRLCCPHRQSKFPLTSNLNPLLRSPMDTVASLVSLHLLCTHTRLLSPSTKPTPFPGGVFHLPETQQAGGWNVTYSDQKQGANSNSTGSLTTVTIDHRLCWRQWWAA